MIKPVFLDSEAWYELLSSMRFAISLLTILGIASVIGTVLRQNEPYPDYITQFGQFWFALFEKIGLYDVYHAAWFLGILCFLVASTGLCLYRNGPLMLREIRSFREHASEISLRHFAHHAELLHNMTQASIVERVTNYLSAHGYRCKTGTVFAAGPVLLAAKTGSYQRIGYILAHAAIVVICFGGLLDGNVPLKLREWFGDKRIETRDIPQSQVPPASRLSASNLSFRGNVTIAEGTSADVVFLNVRDGYMVQELPFIMGVKKFYIEHYSTGQPKSFASDLVITDKETGKSFERTIKVNHPLIYRGIAIYQASFSDGGTRLNFEVWPLLSGQVATSTLHGNVHGSTRLVSGGAEYNVEFTDFRLFNVENLGVPTGGQGLSLTQKLLGNLGPAISQNKELHNVGPSFQYKLRDAQGQAREFNNYMLPLTIDKRKYLLSGMRSNPNEPFRYLRLPVDDQGTLDTYTQLQAELFDPGARNEIARRFAASAMQGDAVSETMRSKLVMSTEKVLEIFAAHGFDGLANFLKQSVPETEQEKVAEIYLKILQNAVLEALQMTYQHLNLKPLEVNDDTRQFVADSLNAMSESFFYGSPLYLQLTDYQEVKATGLQLTRSPGKNIVYTGSVLLVLGVFAMFYIRERRIWLLVKKESALFAMSCNRKTLDFEREFAKHQENISALLKD